MTVEVPDLGPSPQDGSKFRRRPPNPGYRVSRVPKERYVDKVQLNAVLRRIYGRLPTEADIADATAWARNHWRRRVIQLAEAGWGPLGVTGKKSRLPNAMACPVAFVMIYGGKQGRRPCHFRQICPFCWAREVRRHWLKIDAAFFPFTGTKQRVRVVDTGAEGARSTSVTRGVTDVETSVKSPYDLVRRLFTFRPPQIEAWPIANVAIMENGRGRLLENTVVKWSGLIACLESRVRGKPNPQLHRQHECRALLKAAGPGGGMLETISYRRVDDETHPWEVQIHQLILAADGTKVPTQLHPMAMAKPRYHIVIPKPSRRVVVSAVARALRYPDGLIAPQVPIKDIVDYLDARQGRQLVASYGRFRARKT